MHFSSSLLLGLLAVTPSLAVPAAPVDLNSEGAPLEVRGGSGRGGSDWIPIGNKHFRLGREIGRGAFAKVYAAEMSPNPQGLDICVKVHTGSPDITDAYAIIRGRLLKEKEWKNVINLVTAGYGERSNAQYLVMERAGENMESIIRRKGYSGREDLIKRDFLGMVNGVAAMHKGGLAHMDIHAANAVLNRQGTVKLIDFDMIETQRWTTLSCGRSDITSPGELPPLFWLSTTLNTHN
jgi:serine/threonine protein kinase